MNRDKLFNFNVNLVIAMGAYLIALSVYMQLSVIDESIKDNLFRYSLYIVGIILTGIGISPIIINNYFILRNLINKDKK